MDLTAFFWFVMVVIFSKQIYGWKLEKNNECDSFCGIGVNHR
ncbi:hypothetical protein SAMN05878482_10691 [Peribacillus simplex]|uniref:Uncharacterized protein n=1 Tax=Peribacillus simplex TaxID=1478 RepID=A0A9X8RBY8_9BACI|nr:hypothetical protein SAMN05878482_10691 [Peribacillus simplex]